MLQHAVFCISNLDIKSNSLIFDINGFEVEINSYDDDKLGMFENIEEISWNGLTIPILSLRFAKKFYELIGKKEKVELIINYEKKIAGKLS